MASKRKTAVREQLNCRFLVSECHFAGDLPAEATATGVAAQFAGIASLFGSQFGAYLPSVGEVVQSVIHPGAFTKTISEHSPEAVKILWNHDKFGLPLGCATQLAESREGLLVSGKIVDTTQGVDTAKLVRAGVLDELSIGATAIKFDFEDIDGVTIRNVREYALHEISIVPAGANSGSHITDVLSQYDNEFWAGLAARAARATDEELLRLVSESFGIGIEAHATSVITKRDTKVIQKAIELLQTLLTAAEPQPQDKAALTVSRSEIVDAMFRLAELERLIAA